MYLRTWFDKAQAIARLDFLKFNLLLPKRNDGGLDHVPNQNYYITLNNLKVPEKQSNSS